MDTRKGYVYVYFVCLAKFQIALNLIKLNIMQTDHLFVLLLKELCKHIYCFGDLQWRLS
jgi:hypothetical protein